MTGTGTADLTCQARSESGTATVVRGARLPWRTTVDVPVGKDPLISIVLGEDGGTARCALAIRGRHVQGATATGSFGRDMLRRGPRGRRGARLSPVCRSALPLPLPL
ncbi:hypothetical protein [Streptomyces sp. NPDC014006]|uniref:hypothetical protein n=1 Tax=Streptomyces sp. NPDC014006 TaxID=3364870 RepID=UPI0036F68DF9